jgi:hypothetical protein
MTSARRPTTSAQRVAAVVAGVLVAVPLVLVALLATAGPAQASTYRYWTYWWGSDTGKSSAGWTFAKVGPAGHAVGDTWVLGWRFATSRSTTGTARPRQSPDFATLCPRLAPVAGSVRVALVIDYGTTADAPPQQKPPTTASVRVECLTIPGSPRGSDVLRDVSPNPVQVRSENGLICALDGYPKGECAPVVPDPTPTPTPKPTAAKPRASSSTGSGGAPTARSLASPTSSSASASPAPLATTGGSAATSSAAAPAASGPTPSVSGSTDLSESALPAVAGAPAPEAQSSGSPVGLVVGGLVVAAVAGSAWWTSRRRRLG